MSQNWDYAVLSRDAKSAGGPEKYAENLYNDGVHEGILEGISIGIGVSAIGVCCWEKVIKPGAIKIYEFIISRKEKRQLKQKLDKENFIKSFNNLDENDHEDESM